MATAIDGNWSPLRLYSVTVHDGVIPGGSFPATIPNDGDPLDVTIDIPAERNIESIEHVEVQVDITHGGWGDLDIRLYSPNPSVQAQPGEPPWVTSILATPHAESSGPGIWTYLTVRHWDEPAVGEWMLRIRDLGTRGTGSLNAVSLRITGVSATKPIFNDWDGDGDIDLSDSVAFQGCFTGSGGTATVPCREAFDADGDRDVDLLDDIIFDSNFGKTNVGPPNLVAADPPIDWIDPLSQCEDATDTRDRIGMNRPIVLTFDEAVFDQHGFPLDTADFALACTTKYSGHPEFANNTCADGTLNPPTNPCPIVSSVQVSGDGKTLTITLSDPIPYGEWIKLSTTVQNSSGVELPVTYHVAHLPCDIDQDGDVDSADSSAFDLGLEPERVDTNRNGTVNTQDVTEFGSNFNGSGSFVQWNGKSLAPKP